MKRKQCMILVLAFLLLSLGLFASDISYNLARDVAYNKALSVFGSNISLGSGIPYYDIENKLMGYEFGVSLQGKFPEENDIFSMIKAQRVLLEQTKASGGFLDPVQIGKDIAGIKKFAHIFVSANSTDFPVPEYGEGLPDYYQRYGAAKQYAAANLGEEPISVKLYYLAPYLKWFRFSAGEKDVYISMTESGAQKLSPDIHAIKLEKSPGSEIMDRKHLQLWSKLKSGDFSALNPDGRAGYIDSVPEYVWSYGCSPTASAMLMGYWDERGYDRLLDWYFNHYDVVVGQVVLNVPNAQRELAIAMHTDTTTGGTQISWIAQGHLTMANNYNGYSFSASTSPQGTQGNDFVWSWIINEIDGGRPFHWANLYYWFQNQFIHHSVCGYGYTDDKYVIIYNTWGWGEQEWYYYTYHNGTYSKPWVVTAVPGGSEPYKVTLTTPDGGEQWYAGATETVEWTTQGSVDHLGIWFSRNAGKDWTNLTNNAPNTGSYDWFITPDTINTYRARIRLEGYNSSNTLLGADGSAHDFTIHPQTGCTLYVTAPNGGEVWNVGDVHQITWDTYGVQPHHVVISYSPDGGNAWNNIITYPNTHSFNWTIPDDTTHAALVKVRGLSATNELLGEDVSDAFFTIAATGIAEEPSGKWLRPFSVKTAPIPMTSTVSFSIYGSFSPQTSIDIIDISGRIQRHLIAEGALVVWDGKDDKGVSAESGVYFYKVNAGSNRTTGKIVKIR